MYSFKSSALSRVVLTTCFPRVVPNSLHFGSKMQVRDGESSNIKSESINAPTSRPGWWRAGRPQCVAILLRKRVLAKRATCEAHSIRSGSAVREMALAARVCATGISCSLLRYFKDDKIDASFYRRIPTPNLQEAASLPGTVFPPIWRNDMKASSIVVFRHQLHCNLDRSRNEYCAEHGAALQHKG